jgi:hypothetical protein
MESMLWTHARTYAPDRAEQVDQQDCLFKGCIGVGQNCGGGSRSGARRGVSECPLRGLTRWRCQRRLFEVDEAEVNRQAARHNCEGGAECEENVSDQDQARAAHQLGLLRDPAAHTTGADGGVSRSGVHLSLGIPQLALRVGLHGTNIPAALAAAAVVAAATAAAAAAATCCMRALRILNC